MNFVIKKYMRRILCIVMMLVMICGSSTVYAALQDGEGDGTGPSIGFADIISACEISEYRAGKEYDEYTYPTKEGYEFLGWVANKQLNTIFDKLTAIYSPKWRNSEGQLVIKDWVVEGYGVENTPITLKEYVGDKEVVIPTYINDKIKKEINHILNEKP